jgi:hypothetical protein
MPRIAPASLGGDFLVLGRHRHPLATIEVIQQRAETER